MSEKKIYDIVSKTKLWIALPCIVFAIALVILVIFKAEVSIEFRGGSILTYSYNGKIDLDQFKKTIDEQNLGIGSAHVTIGSAISSDLETVTLEFSSNRSMNGETQGVLTSALQESFPDNNLKIISSQDVNPSTGSNFFLKCLVAVIFSFILLVIYIAFRFKKIGGWAAGVFALISLMVDVFMVGCTFIFFRLDIDANFMAVVLTILGYSINNVIVIYDRVRENKTLYGNKLSYRDLVNKSISQSFTRSLYTTLTTGSAITVVCIVAVFTGVNSIISFSLPMIVGIFSGFFSSLCLAGPLWVLWREYRQRKNVKIINN